MLTKKIISDKLSSFYLDDEKIDIISKGSVKNIVIFDKEIVIDLEVVNPTLKSKNLIKENLYNYLKEQLNIEISLKINFQIASKPIENKIYNPLKKITNISNIIAVSSGKVELENQQSLQI
jgi:ATP-binding protein involved in chromosome partitioning